MPHDVVAELPAQSNSAVRYTEGMNKWFQESLLNNRPWMETLITAGTKQYFEKWFAPMFQDLCEPVLEDIGKALDKDRRIRREEDEAVVAEMKRFVEGKFETKFLPRLDALDQSLARIGRELEGRLGPGVLHKHQRAAEAKLETKLEALEQRLAATSQAAQQTNSSNGQRLATIDQRTERLERDLEGRLGPGALHESQRAAESKIEAKLEAKLTELEERLRATAAELPVARNWAPESVTYKSEFVAHEGALWQARKDTATTPGGDAWLCVARAGRDAVTPTVRGTYDAYDDYKALDIVALHGGTFIAKRDNPGVCPGDGWQLLCKQGRVGRPGPCGERGERGECGEKGPAVMPKLISSKIDENYNLVILRADDSLEIIPLREGYERYHQETSE